MSKELEALKYIKSNMETLFRNKGDFLYDKEEQAFVDIEKALEEKEKQDKLINILFKIGLIDHIIGRLGCMNTRTEEGKKERRFLLDFVENNIKHK